MQLRLARHTDLVEIAAMSEQLLEYGMRPTFTEARLERIIEHPDKNLLLAAVDGQIAGFACMSYYQQTASLDLLAVDPSFRQEGIGSSLVLWLEKVAVNLGIQRIMTHLRESNQTSLKFYFRLGYQEKTRNARVYGYESQIKLTKYLVNAPDMAE